MAKKSHPRLLEVTVTPLEPTRWEWRVYEGDTPLMTGFETSRETAQIEGDSALFRLLSARQLPLSPKTSVLAIGVEHPLDVSVQRPS
jgi:hypothetical protein